MKGKKVLLCVTGSIAAYRACDLISGLKQAGVSVTCAMTRGAQEFITPLTLRSLNGGRVYTDLFSEYEGVLHTTLADESDLVVIAPASANVIARIASGMADDLVTSVVLATLAPVLIVPAMNDNMYRNPATRQNLKTLRERGFEFVDPIKGPLVCGREEIGHIAGAEAILSRVKALLKEK